MPLPLKTAVAKCGAGSSKQSVVQGDSIVGIFVTHGQEQLQWL